MSRKHSARSPQHHARTTHIVATLSAQELEARWNSLHLHPQTKDHLEHLLQFQGLALAVAATKALDLEMQHEEQKMTRSLWGWISEELRLSFLEEGCEHIIESGRLIIGASLAWPFVQGPFIMKLLAFLFIALAVFLIFCCWLVVSRRRHASNHAQEH